jgi:hypothetical protein
MKPSGGKYISMHDDDEVHTMTKGTTWNNDMKYKQ